jgi:SulP family sulfate permease
VVAPFFGGMPATGTIARTVTNIKSGAVSPVSGIVHALTLVLIIWLAAPLAQHVLLASPAAILMFVAWNMGKRMRFVQLKQFRLPYRITLIAVFLLTVVVDLTVAVQVGLIAACITFIDRISSLTRSEPVSNKDYPELTGCASRVQGFRLYGALFFCAVNLLETISSRLPEKALMLDLKNVIYMDSSGADVLQDMAHHCTREGFTLWFADLGISPWILRIAAACSIICWLRLLRMTYTMVSCAHKKIAQTKTSSADRLSFDTPRKI